MQKTTVYLSDELKRGIARVAREEGCSEAEVIRAALGEAIARSGRPRPTVPLWVEGFGGADVAERVDEVLAGGFGRDAAS
jgi:hypothetical protein